MVPDAFASRAATATMAAMTSSRMKTAALPAMPAADCHHIEVGVPAVSRLAPVVGGLPGREPPRANRLIESIAAALRAAATDSIPRSTWLVAPSRRIGNQWIETLARTGTPTANVHVTTVSALAYDIIAAALAAESIQLAPRRAKVIAVERLLVEHHGSLASLGQAGGSVRRLAERVLHSLEALRAAGLTPADVARGLRHMPKARDVALLMDRYEGRLQELHLVDVAGELSRATDHAREGRLPPSLRRLLVPDDIELHRLERGFLEALVAAGVEVIPLATDGGPAPSMTAATLPPHTIFRAAGEANEVRFVLRTILERGLRLDEVEIVHTDAATYPALVREIVAALPLPCSARAEQGSEDHLPVTFADGLPLADSKPGRALVSWLEWQRDGHPQSGLERMLRDGLLQLPRDATTADTPRASTLVPTLRGVKIGRGFERTVSLVAAAVVRASARPPEAFARGREDDDDWSEDPHLLGVALLEARKQRSVGRLEALDAIVKRLAACEPTPGPVPASGTDVVRAAKLFLETLCPADSELDGNARRLLLDEIDAMLAWQGDAETAAAHDIVEWLTDLPAEMVVLGAGPRPGCLHVSSLGSGGHAGRPYTFVLGLDENRFPGRGGTDPVLTDGDRELLNACDPAAGLTVAHDALARTLAAWQRLLARLRGHVWLGFSCRDTSEDAEVFPAPALLALFATATGNPRATLEDLLGALPPAATLVPPSPATALTESQQWLAALGPSASPAAVDAARAGHREHLDHGRAAAAARAADAFTPHDGLVPAAGRLLDPRGPDAKAASANTLETLGGCPRRFFFRYGLGVEPLDHFDDDTDRWLTPRDVGSLLHTVLERFMRRLIDRGELPDVARHLDELLAILDDALDENRRARPPLTELSFTARRAELQMSMRTFLLDEERSCRETGMRPVALETAIGLEPTAAGTPFDAADAVAVTLAPGETIRLRGRIDRIDARGDGDSRAYAIIDYKSGGVYGFPAPGAADPFSKGRRLQHGLYVVMLRERLGRPDCRADKGHVERFAYFFPSRTGKGRRLAWTSEQLADCTRLVRQLAEIAGRGLFLPTTNREECGFCDYARVCGDPGRVARAADRMLQASGELRGLFAGLTTSPRQPAPLPLRRPHATPLARVPHPPASATPADEPVRARIRDDLRTTLLVEAAAGTGKTTCMVDRMLALVRTGTATPEGIVAVTFTRKAAGELRRRFREKLQAAVAAATDTVERDRLVAALGRIDSMVIGTIHSFAGRLLRERPLEAGVDPGFRELDDAADRLVRRQAWREFVTAAPDSHPDLLARLEAVGLRLSDFSRAFLQRFATYGDVDSWPAPETPPPDPAAIVAALTPFVDRIEEATFPPPADRGTDDLMNALEQFARMFRRCDTNSLVAVADLLQELDLSPKVIHAGWPGTGVDDREVKASRKALAEQWKHAWEHVRDTIARPALWRWRAHRYPLAIAVLREAQAVYDRIRSERGVLSFQDLLCKAASVVADAPDVRRGFRSRYTHILVDEFQDTDPVQAQLLLLLVADDPTQRDWRQCRPVPGSLFVVGDPKQSLYRFRRADIVTYSTVRRIIAAHGDVLSLTTNFRSRGDLVNWVNDVFSREFPPQPTLHSPSFTPSESGRREPPTEAKDSAGAWLSGLRMLRFTRAGNANDAWAETEAREIARFIRGAVDAGVQVPRTTREIDAGIGPACRPGDFLVIPRERRHLGIYAEALHAVGLPVDVTGTLGADQAEPLRPLRDCLAAVADPDDPVAALALLRGEVFGFSDADLHAYKQAGGRIGGGIDTPATLDQPLGRRFTAAREALARWRRWVRLLPVAAAVDRIIDDAGLMLVAAAAEGEAGPRGRALAGLLDKYVESIRSDRLEIVSLHDCLDLLDDMVDVETRNEVDPLSIDAPSTDRVRVMNLHKAKGLEAPVVFLADYQRRDPGEKPEDGPFLHIDRTGESVAGWLAITGSGGRAARIIAAPPEWPTLCAREREFERAEQIRLDYVAATRPGACLVISLFEKHDAGTKSRPESYDAEGAWDRFKDFLGAAADLPEPLAWRAPAPVARDDGPAATAAELSSRLADCLQRSFSRISPREVLTEPAEGMRFTGHGLGEPWGRAIHRLLELSAEHPDLDLEAAAGSTLSSEDLSPALASRAVATVRTVMASDIWKRSQVSDRRFVEVPFSIQVGGEDLPEQVRHLAGDGTPLPTVVRGVIDMVFQEPDGRWTVVDWKTDSVTAASEELLDAHYRPQVELYADCWRHLTMISASGAHR
jgi:ATP-dependent helicase/nuclease subunit A